MLKNIAEFVPQAVAQIDFAQNAPSEIMQHLVAQIDEELFLSDL